MSKQSSRIPSRFIFYLMTGSAFLFVLSLVFLFEFSTTKIVSSRVLNLILDNSNSIHYRSTSTSYLSTVIPRSHIGDGIPSEGPRTPCNPSDGVVEASSPLKKMIACDPGKALLRVYMYACFLSFTFDCRVGKEFVIRIGRMSRMSCIKCYCFDHLQKGIIRQELFYLLKEVKDVQFTFGSVQGQGLSKAGQGMASLKFCLNIAGDTRSSNHLFDAIVNHCVPVIISDEFKLPFDDVLDYSKFCIFIRSTDAVKKDFLLSHLRGISKDEWTEKWNRLKEVARHYKFQYPSQPSDAVDMIWQVDV